MKNNFSNRLNKSFTLIELLVVLALVAILSVVVILTLNPAELIKQARDSNRLSDLATIDTALNLFSADVTSGFMGTSTIVYVSIPDNASSTCGSLGLPILPTGYTYNCVTTANLRNTDGFGWIPVNFQRISSNSPISQLPIDPINTTTTGNYYTYVSGGSWILTAIPESTKQKADLSLHPQITNYPGVIGMGNNLGLSPLFNSTGLVGYWKFDEGSGTTTADSSGLGGTGIINTVTWASNCKSGNCLFFSGGNVSISNVSSFDSQSYSFASWIRFNGSQAYASFARRLFSSTHGWEVNTNGDGGMGCRMDTSFMSNYGCNGANNIEDGVWHHVAVTYSNDTSMATVFVDGSQKTTISIPGTITTGGGSLVFGGPGWGNTFPGWMDDIRIYNRALSVSEVAALYNAIR